MGARWEESFKRTDHGYVHQFAGHANTGVIQASDNDRVVACLLRSHYGLIQRHLDHVLRIEIVDVRRAVFKMRDVEFSALGTVVAQRLAYDFVISLRAKGIDEVYPASHEPSPVDHFSEAWIDPKVDKKHCLVQEIYRSVSIENCAWRRSFWPGILGNSPCGLRHAAG